MTNVALLNAEPTEDHTWEDSAACKAVGGEMTALFFSVVRAVMLLTLVTEHSKYHH